MATAVDQVRPLSLRQADGDPAGFAAALGGSFERFGFAIITDHGVDPALIDRAWAMTRAFFALPVDVKQHYQLAGSGEIGRASCRERV